MDEDTRATLAELVGEVRALRQTIEMALPQYLRNAEAEKASALRPTGPSDFDALGACVRCAAGEPCGEGHPFEA